MGPPRICILEVFTLLFFLASTRRCCHVFPGPGFWHTSHSRSLVTVTETQRTQQRAVSCSRLSDLQSLEVFTTLQYLQIEYPLTLLCSQSPYFEQPQTTKKANHPRPKSQFQTNEVQFTPDRLKSFTFFFIFIFMCLQHVWFQRASSYFLGSRSGMDVTAVNLWVVWPLGICLCCNLWHERKDKGSRKKTQKVLEEQVRGSNGEGERVGSWITMARVQGWLIVSDTLQFWGLYQHCFYSCN